ncbi:MAG: phosphoglycerate kinase [Chitinophagaceae bacterium]|nr:MAG: phosphoglycerate kinase [Chitinophagaceae bacterium]
MASFSHYNFKNKKVLIRVDFNVPLDADMNITDDTRIKASLATITKVLQEGGSAILMSHLGRPKNGPVEKYSLKHLVSPVNKLLNEAMNSSVKLVFANDCRGEEVKLKAQALQNGEVLLLENLRFYKEEESGDEAFAKELATLGDVYINDAFGTAHRAHASTAVMAKYFSQENKMFGLLMEKEVASAEKILQAAKQPFVAIIGGAKVSDKILILENLLEKATDIIIGGGMAYTFIKAKGGEIGNSLCENEKLEIAKTILNKAAASSVQIHLPIDSIIANKFAANADTQEIESEKIPAGWMGLDIGSKACHQFKEVILRSNTILWNGPMGVFEMEKFSNGTKQIAKSVAEATERGAFSLVGGGDSVAAINELGFADKVSYVSTGGGALLEYFEGKILPGIAAINSK